MDRRFFRHERGDESLVERVAALEVVDGILVRFSKNAGFDEVEDHFTEILAARDAPIGENRGHHRAEFLQRVLAQAVEQLRAGDVGRAVLVLFAELDRVVQPVAEEKVGIAGVARVLGTDGVQCFCEFALGHFGVYFGGTGGHGKSAVAFDSEQSGVIKNAPQERRRKTMRDVRNRQQALLAAAVFCVVAAAFSAPRKEDDAAAKELQKLEMEGIALTARNAGGEDWQKLGENFAALTVRHPKNAAIRDAHGDFLWRMNDREGALREWLAGERIEPKNADILNHLGGAYMTQHDPKTALGFYLRATESEPGDAHAHFSAATIAGLFRHDLGRTEDESFALALKHFAEAHRLAPENPEFARAYAETFYLLPRPDWQTALKVWKDYLKLSPEKNFALLNLTRVHMKLGDAESARACLAQVTGLANERQKNRLAARINAELSPEGAPSADETEKTSKPFIDEGEPRP